MKALIFNGSRILLDSDLAGIRLLLIDLRKEEEMLEQKEEYDNIKNKKPWGLEKLAELFKGISGDEINEKSEKIVREKLRGDAKEIIKKIKDKGFLVVVYSSDLINISKVLMEELELDGFYGNILEFENGIATGKMDKKVDRYDRVDRIKRLIEENNLSKEDVFIVGESVTAIPSAELGTMIAFNSDSDELNQMAKYKIFGLDELLEIVN